MNERQPDIDALLISALYGELTPSEETRLAAHLDAHPADRAALANLTQARDAVRESRILQVQVEPPQSVSALLLQEAARRAPAKKGDESEGFFARFFRSFMAHPAMAAAAMLVIVIGVATLVAKRKPDLARSMESSEQEAARVESPSATIAAGSAAPSLDQPAKNDLAMPEAGSAYRVGLADDGKAAEGQTEYKDEAAKGGKKSEVLDSKLAKPEPVSAPTVAKPSITKEAASHDGYLELRKQDQVPKDFDDAPAPAKKKAMAAPSGSTAVGGNADGDTIDRTETTATFDSNLGSFRGGAGGGVSTGATSNAPPPPPPPAPRTSIATTPRADRTVDKAPAPAPAQIEEKPADPANAWAQNQHKNLIAQVKAGNCQDAANIAVDLSNRAPAYYQQNVANDRSVKQCLAYITAEREKAEELRAQKNRASATKRAADEPARAKATKPTSTSTDSSK